MSPGPVTIGDLKREGWAARDRLPGVRAHLYVDPAGVELPDRLPVPQAAACLLGLRSIEPADVAPDLRQTGCSGAGVL